MSLHLITGATGYLGQALTSALLARGDSVGIVIRGDRTSAMRRAQQLFPEYASCFGRRLTVFTGDVTAPGLEISPSIDGVVGSKDLSVWHLAASLSFNDDDKEAIVKTNADGTRNVVEFANRHASRLYHVSTAFVCGDSRAVLDEDQLELKQHFHNWYEQSKYVGEKIVRDECRVPFVVFRPSIIVGDASELTAGNCSFGYYRFTSMFYLLKRRLVRAFTGGPPAVKLALRALGTRYEPAQDVLYAPWLVLPYPLHSTVNLVHIEDVVSAMAAAPNLNVPSGTTFHLSQGNPPTFTLLLKAILSDLKLEGAKCVGLPPSFFRSFFRVLYYVLAPFFSRKRNRRYFHSLLKYLPYISQDYRFSFENTKAYLPVAGPITRDRLRAINRQSPESVLTNPESETDAGNASNRPDRVPNAPALVTSLIRPFRGLDNREAASSLLKITYGGEL